MHAIFQVNLGRQFRYHKVLACKLIIFSLMRKMIRNEDTIFNSSGKVIMDLGAVKPARSAYRAL